MIVMAAPYPNTGGGGLSTTVLYNFNTDTSPTISDATITASNMTAGPGLNEFAVFNTGGYPTQVIRVTEPSTTQSDAIANGSYFFCTINAPGRTLTRVQISAARGGSSTPRSFFTRSSADGYAADMIPPQDVPTQRPNLTAYNVTASIAVSGSITIRFFMYTNTSNISIEYDDIMLTFA